MPQQTTHRAEGISDSPEALNPSVPPAPGLLSRVMDGFAFSGGLAAAIGASLSGVASHALDAPNACAWAFLAGSGTFIVYALDRLRDTDRDRVSSPLRTAFVLRNRRRLYFAVGVVALGFTATLFSAPASIGLLCMAIGGIGLLHRRLKENAAMKVAYVSLAWVAACFGMPWLASGRESADLWGASVLLGALAANLLASNSRGPETPTGGGFGRNRSAMMLRGARGMAFGGIVIALTAPAAFHALVWIPIAEGLALAAFRPSERYGQFAVDGALLLGAIATTIHFALVV